MISFDWNEAKGRSNQLKHGFSFEDAVQIFDDPFYRSYPDQVVDGEQRWHALGMTDGMLLILVVHTIVQESLLDEVIRIISARRATPRERKFYGLYDGSVHP